MASRLPLVNIINLFFIQLRTKCFYWKKTFMLVVTMQKKTFVRYVFYSKRLDMFTEIKRGNNQRWYLIWFIQRCYGKFRSVECDAAREMTHVHLFVETMKKTRKNISGYIENNNFSSTGVPVARRTSVSPLNNSENNIDKRNHFPIDSSCAITIHKI